MSRQLIPSLVTNRVENPIIKSGYTRAAGVRVITSFEDYLGAYVLLGGTRVNGLIPDGVVESACNRLIKVSNLDGVYKKYTDTLAASGNTPVKAALSMASFFIEPAGAVVAGFIGAALSVVTAIKWNSFTTNEECFLQAANIHRFSSLVRDADRPEYIKYMNEPKYDINGNLMQMPLYTGSTSRSEDLANAGITALDNQGFTVLKKPDGSAVGYVDTTRGIIPPLKPAIKPSVIAVNDTVKPFNGTGAFLPPVVKPVVIPVVVPPVVVVPVVVPPVVLTKDIPTGSLPPVAVVVTTPLIKPVVTLPVNDVLTKDIPTGSTPSGAVPVVAASPAGGGSALAVLTGLFFMFK